MRMKVFGNRWKSTLRSPSRPDGLQRFDHSLEADAPRGLHQDPVAARALIPRDKEVDALNKQIYRDLSNQMMHDPETVTRCLNLMIVAKSLERIGDHATNVAEEVVYLCEAQDIRHTGKGASAAFETEMQHKRAV